MTQIKKAAVAAILLVILIAVGAVYAAVSGSASGSDRHVIPSSYIFDVSDPRLVAGYADNVFVGRVERRVDVESDAQRTLYAVKVLERLKGTVSGEVTVSQLGYVDGEDVYVLEDQPLLVVGRTYLVATTDGQPDGNQTLIGGPAASIRITSDAQRRDVVASYRQAVKEQRFPPGVPRH